MAVQQLLCVLLLLAIGVLGVSEKINNRPIVGILTQPTGSSMAKYGESYIAASYVKYIESAGARVVPIFHNSTEEQLDEVFNSINGILFPGGGADLVKTPLYYSGLHLFKRMQEANDKGDYFPLFGHCMGFELIAMIVSQNMQILSHADAENISLPLNFTSAATSSKWLGTAPKHIYDTLANQPVTLNNHVECVDLPDFHGNQYLPEFFTILSTNLDKKGKEFISTMEGKKYPVFAMQWHAEKVQFEWNPHADVNHSFDSVLANQYFGNYAVNEARKNLHHYSSEKTETASLIYNYEPLYSEAFSSFEQVYVF